MKYSYNYSEIFILTRNAIRCIVQHDYNHIKDCNNVGVHVSIDTISYAADNLTAYNELSPDQWFMSIKKVI